MFLVLPGIAMLLSCANTSTNFLYAALPSQNEINAYREDPNSGVLTTLSITPITAGEGVRSLLIHPSKKFMYAANSVEDDISVYDLSVSGAITEKESSGRTPAGTTPSLLVMDKAGQFLYAANTGSNNISSFSIGSTDGSLTVTPGSPFTIGAEALNMQVSPSGNFLYVTVGIAQSGTTGSIEVWPLTAGVLGQIAQVLPTGTTPFGLAIHPNGNFLYTANFGDNSISEYTINSDGTLSVLGTVSSGLADLSSPVALLINNAGTFLYVANQSSSTVAGYTIGSDGSLALIPSSPTVITNSTPSTIASDASGHYLYVGNNVNPAIESFAVDLNTGALTAVQSDRLGSTTTSLALTP
jgi:6-phosphogluconolactonase (cycloisomerase 2 family)